MLLTLMMYIAEVGCTN